MSSLLLAEKTVVRRLRCIRLLELEVRIIVRLVLRDTLEAGSCRNGIAGGLFHILSSELKIGVVVGLHLGKLGSRLRLWHCNILHITARLAHRSRTRLILLLLHELKMGIVLPNSNCTQEAQQN